MRNCFMRSFSCKIEVKNVYKALDFVPHMDYSKPSPFLLIYSLLDNRE